METNMEAYQKLETISLPESAVFLCCLGVPLVTLNLSLS